MLGVSKKNKLEPPKSIQLAAAVAKKVNWSFTYLVVTLISSVLSNRRNRIAKQPVLKRWRRDGRQCFKRR
jgi:hypothetical protein